MNPNDKKAEERFKEISEANDVLSDAKKRKIYDQLGFYSDNIDPAAAEAAARGGYGGGFSAVAAEAAAAGTARRRSRSILRGLIFPAFRAEKRARGAVRRNRRAAGLAEAFATSSAGFFPAGTRRRRADRSRERTWSTR